MRRLALVLLVASLVGVLSLGAESSVAAASSRPAKTTCTVFYLYNVGNTGQAVCGYGTGTVTNSGLTIQWADGQTSTLSSTGWTSTELSGRKCPTIPGDTFSIELRWTGGTVASGPLAGSHVRERFC